MWYWIFRFFFLCVLKLFFRFRIEGIDNLPAKTNFIVVANHCSLMDTMVVGSLPRKIYWIAGRKWYDIPGLRWFLKNIHTLPSGSVSEGAIRLLVANKNIGVFPEGLCSLDGKLTNFKRGAALFAIRTGRPIVPCAILGSFQALPWGACIPTFVPIKLIIGKPIFLLKEFSDTIDDVLLQEGMFKVRKAIQEMIDAG